VPSHFVWILCTVGQYQIPLSFQRALHTYVFPYLSLPLSSLSLPDSVTLSCLLLSLALLRRLFCVCLLSLSHAISSSLTLTFKLTLTPSIYMYVCINGCLSRARVFFRSISHEMFSLTRARSSPFTLSRSFFLSLSSSLPYSFSLALSLVALFSFALSLHACVFILLCAGSWLRRGRWLWGRRCLWYCLQVYVFLCFALSPPTRNPWPCARTLSLSVAHSSLRHTHA